MEPKRTEGANNEEFVDNFSSMSDDEKKNYEICQLKKQIEMLTNQRDSLTKYISEQKEYVSEQEKFYEGIRKTESVGLEGEKIVTDLCVDLLKAHISQVKFDKKLFFQEVEKIKDTDLIEENRRLRKEIEEIREINKKNTEILKEKSHTLERELSSLKNSIIDTGRISEDIIEPEKEEETPPFLKRKYSPSDDLYDKKRRKTDSIL